MKTKVYHVHIYKVTALAEVNVLATSKQNARRKAREELESSIADPAVYYKAPDCENIAIAYKRA